MEFRKNQKTKKLIYSSYRNLYISNLFHQVSKYSCETYMKPIFLKIFKYMSFFSLPLNSSIAQIPHYESGGFCATNL